MLAIAICDLNGAMGLRHRSTGRWLSTRSLFGYYPEDSKWFRRMTKGRTMITGRATFEAEMRHLDLSNPRRKMIVVTSHDHEYTWRGPRPLASELDLCRDRTSYRTLSDIRSMPEAARDDAIVCGGERTYQELVDADCTVFVTVACGILTSFQGHEPVLLPSSVRPPSDMLSAVWALFGSGGRSVVLGYNTLYQPRKWLLVRELSDPSKFVMV